MKPFFISIPHSGEKIPSTVKWLEGLPEEILMCDVDRYVDAIYYPIISKLKIPSIVSEWHRYVVDLNRWISDIDQSSVVGSENLVGTHPKGLHWSVTTKGFQLLKTPMSKDLHEELVNKYYHGFQKSIQDQYDLFKKKGIKMIYQLDAHSMPSMGTGLHRDKGEKRKDVVISDCHGKSCCTDYKEIVIASFQKAGFDVGYNWPYVGGRITESYGKPEIGQSCIQVELNRALYMNEDNKQKNLDLFSQTVAKVSEAVTLIYQWIPF